MPKICPRSLSHFNIYVYILTTFSIIVYLSQKVYNGRGSTIRRAVFAYHSIWRRNFQLPSNHPDPCNEHWNLRWECKLLKFVQTTETLFRKLWFKSTWWCTRMLLQGCWTIIRIIFYLNFKLQSWKYSWNIF